MTIKPEEIREAIEGAALGAALCAAAGVSSYAKLFEDAHAKPAPLTQPSESPATKQASSTQPSESPATQPASAERTGAKASATQAIARSSESILNFRADGLSMRHPTGMMSVGFLQLPPDFEFNLMQRQPVHTEPFTQVLPTDNGTRKLAFLKALKGQDEDWTDSVLHRPMWHTGGGVPTYEQFVATKSEKPTTMPTQTRSKD